MELLGCIKWFESSKGFGVVISNNDKEFFLHSSNLNCNDYVPKIGTPILFYTGFERGKKTALNAKIPKKIEDFYSLISHISENQKIMINAKDYNPLILGIKKVIKGLGKEVIIKLFQNAFDEKIILVKDNDLLVKYFRITKAVIGNLTINFNLNTFEEKSIFSSVISSMLTDEGVETIPDDTTLPELIEYYISKLNSDQKFWLWKNDELGYTFDYSFIETRNQSVFFNFLYIDKFLSKELTFKEEIIFNNFTEIGQREFNKILHLNRKDSLVPKLLDIKIRNCSQSSEELKNIVRLFSMSSGIDINKQKEQLISLITNDLIFDYWYNKSIFIDLENNEIRDFKNEDEFEISEDLLLKNLDKLNYPEFERILSFINGKMILNLLLETKINIITGLISVEKSAEIIKTIKLLRDPEEEISLVESLIENLSIENTIEHILKLKITAKIEKKSMLFQFYNYPFNFSDEEQMRSISNHLLKSSLNVECWRFIKCLNYKQDIQEFINRVPRLNDDDKILLIKEIFDYELFKKTLSCWEFKSVYLTMDLLALSKSQNYSKQDFPESFLNELTSNLTKFDEVGLTNILKLNLINELPEKVIEKLTFQNSAFTDELIKKLFIADEDASKFQNASSKLEESFYKQSVKLGIKEFLSTISVFYRNKIKLQCLKFPEKFLKVVVSKGMLEYVIEWIEENKTIWKEKIFIQFILDEVKVDIEDLGQYDLMAYLKKINNPTLLQMLIQATNIWGTHYKNEIIELFKEQKFKVYEEIILDTLTLPNKTFSADLIDLTYHFKNEAHLASQILNVDLKSESDVKKLIRYFTNKPEVFSFLSGNANAENIKLKAILSLIEFFITEGKSVINDSFRKTINDSSGVLQLFAIQFLSKVYYKDKRRKEHILSFIKTLELEELSAILFRYFIFSKPVNIQDLAIQMNDLLFNQYEVIQNKNKTKEDFFQLVSINNLVKRCHGRMKPYNLNYWEKGKRWYGNGMPEFKFDETLNLYCEGRFWEKSVIYDSNTKQQTNFILNQYWCRGGLCVQVNDKADCELDFTEWTLSELAVAFDKKIERLGFTVIAGWANRMKEIIEKLVCRECGSILRPLATKSKILGYYGVPFFNCLNSSCNKFKYPIRFTHCIKCGKTLDSRDCALCSNINYYPFLDHKVPNISFSF